MDRFGVKALMLRPKTNTQSTSRNDPPSAVPRSVIRDRKVVHQSCFISVLDQMLLTVLHISLVGRMCLDFDIW